MNMFVKRVSLVAGFIVMAVGVWGLWPIFFGVETADTAPSPTANSAQSATANSALPAPPTTAPSVQ